MNISSEETSEGSKHIRKSIGYGGGGGGLSVSGGKTRQYSIGVTGYRKIIGEDANVVPNYLRASTGSCHDFCKFGKNHEHSKSAIPIKFKKTYAVHTDNFTKIVVPLQNTKTTLKSSTNVEILSSTEPVKKPHVSKQSSSAHRNAPNESKSIQRSTSRLKTSSMMSNSEGSNVGIKRVNIKTVKMTGLTPKNDPIEKFAHKTTSKESKSLEASFGGDESLKVVNYRNVPPSKDQNLMQKTGHKQTKTLHGVETEPEVQHETMEFDNIESSTESINDPICNSSESCSGKNTIEEKSIIRDAVHERSAVSEVKSSVLMNISSEETSEEGKHIRKSIGYGGGGGDLSLSGGKTKRYSIGVTCYRKSIGEDANMGIKRVDKKIVKKTCLTPKLSSVENFAHKTIPKESKSLEASFSGDESLKAINYRGVKKLPPSKDQILIQNLEPKQTRTLHGVEAELEDKHETMKFEFIQLSTESISYPTCKSSKSCSGKNTVEEKSTIKDAVHERPETFADEIVKESLIEHVVESSHSCSEKELLTVESSKSFYDDNVLEEFTDDEDVVEVSEGSEIDDTNKMETLVRNQIKIPRKGMMIISRAKDNETVKLRFRRGRVLDLRSENNGPRRLKFRRSVTESNEDGRSIAKRTYKNKTLDLQTKISGGKESVCRSKYIKGNDESMNGPESVVLKHQYKQDKPDGQGLLNDVIEEIASKLVESRKSKVKALVDAFDTVISLQDGKSYCARRKTSSFLSQETRFCKGNVDEEPGDCVRNFTQINRM